MGFLDGTSSEMRFASLGFLIAVVGAAMGFSSFAIDHRWIGISGYVIVVIGISVGFVAIIFGFIRVFRQR
jgi:hypothetical protein